VRRQVLKGQSGLAYAGRSSRPTSGGRARLGGTGAAAGRAGALPARSWAKSRSVSASGSSPSSFSSRLR